MHILFLSRWYPYPPDNGSRIRIFNLLKHLSERHDITLLSFTDDAVSDQQRAAMLDYCLDVQLATYRTFKPHKLKALLGFFAPRPRSVVDTYSVEMQRRVDTTLQRQNFDVVIASQIDMAPYVLDLQDVPRILEEIELGTIYDQYANARHPLKRLRFALTWWKLRRYVVDILKHFDGCTAVSEIDLQLLNGIAPHIDRVRVIPNGTSIARAVRGYVRPQPDTLIYSGALTYRANFDAIDYFLREIFPRIQAQRPQAKLLVTGKTDGVPLDRLPQHDGVVFTGYLDDIHSAIAQSWVSIVPLRIGGGTRLKILEALALGTPVVSTSKGVQGLELTPRQDLLVADEPARFADAVVQVLKDEVYRKMLGDNGQRAVSARYNWQTIAQQLDEFIEQVARDGRAEHRQPIQRLKSLSAH
jgi:glycosyltransferase involved in cell wall biosynthesis